MLPIIRKRVISPAYLDDFFAKDLLTSLFNDGADYTTPAVNIKENEKEFMIEVAAPGLSKEDIQIKLEKDVLTISSEVENKNDEIENDHFMRKEFGFQSFSRSFKLPESVDQEKIQASHKNGILTVELPRIDEAKLKNTKMIKIS